MNKNELLDKIINKKVKDYSFTIAFFFIFSFFIIFAIKPNLNSVVTLSEQLNQLKVLDRQYEDTISKIINLQTLIVQNRDNFYLLDDALPSTPQVNKVIDDIKKDASDSGLILEKMEVQEISLKEDESKNKMKTLSVLLESTASFDNVKVFIDTLMSQRRLKNIKSLNLIKDISEGTESSTLKIKLEVGGFYL